MADTNKVTIDAEWFAELYAAKKDNEMYGEAVINIAKERDELKAALEIANKTNSAQADQLRDALNENEELKAKLESREKSLSQATLGEFNRLRESLAAAERCIEDCEAASLMWRSDGDDAAVRSMFDNARAIIRAYREQKEAVK